VWGCVPLPVERVEPHVFSGEGQRHSHLVRRRDVPVLQERGATEQPSDPTWDEVQPLCSQKHVDGDGGVPDPPPARTSGGPEPAAGSLSGNSLRRFGPTIELSEESSTGTWDASV
jgi:hypothetical protein